MSTTLDVSLKVLYVQGLAGEVDRTATDQLRKASAELHITTIAGSAAALAELRRTPGWQALFASPSLPQNEVLALIASLRRDRIPIAIVPILDDVHQDLFASAVASGADDVLVRRNGTLVNINETLTRIRQSPHLFPAEQRRRISVLYAGRDPLVWNLLDQVPFVKADRVATGIDGTCPVRRPGAGDDSLRADAVIIDEAPGDAHPLQVLKSVKAQASDLPVIMLTSAGAADIATAALELGADDTVLKTGIFRRRLIATLRRVHQRIELSAQQLETRTREERLRQIVENVPTGITVVAGDGRVLAMNAAALRLFGAAKPRDIVGRDFRDMAGTGEREALTDLIRRVTKGEPGSLDFEARTLTGERLEAHIDAVVLERDARGGRGLVASIRQAAPPQAEANAPGRTAELSALRDALQTLERHYAELEEARRHEREAWESERQRLETRLEEAERLAAERGQLEARLAEVSAELARAGESFATERQGLEQRLRELETAARDASTAGAARTELERALEAVREEQRQAIAAHTLERSGWQDIRAELEARVQQLDTMHQSEQDTLVASLREDVGRLEQTLSEERSRWQTTREQLEAELRDAREALWAEHSGRDAARATFDAELETLRATLEQERANTQEAQRAAEAALHQSRAELEQQLRAVQETLDQERGEWTDNRGSLEEAAALLATSLETERARWSQEREALEAERRQLLESGVQQGDLSAERSRLEADLEAGRQQWLTERTAAEIELTRLREQAERADATARALTDEYDATRARLEQQRDDTLSAVEQTRSELQEQVTRLAAEVQDARAQADAAAAERDDAHARLAAAQAALERAQADAREWQDRMAAAEAAIAAATDKAAEQERVWQQERAGLLESAAEAQTCAQKERGHLVSLHARELEEWRSAVEQARSERDQASGRLDALDSDLEETRRQLAEIEAVRADLHQAHSRVATLEADLNATRQQLGELDTLRGALDAARGEHDEAHRRVAALEADLNATRQQLGELDTLRGALDAARGERDEAHSRVATLEADLNATRQQLGELDTLRGALDAARGEHDEAHRRVAALEADLNATRQQLGELDTLRGALDAARGERDQAHSRVAALEADLNATRQQLGELDTLRGALDAARGERDQAHSRVAALEADLNATRQQLGELDTLRGALDAARGALDVARGDLDQAHHRVVGLEAALGDARQQLAELANLRASLDGERDERAQLKARVASLDRDLADARRVAHEHQAAFDALEAARSEILHTDAAHHAERETWERMRQGIERELHEAEARHAEDREVWSRQRAEFEAEVRDAVRLLREQQHLKDSIATLQGECAALTATLADERDGHDRERRELHTLRLALADSHARLADMDNALERAARSAGEQLAQQQARHDARERELEEDIRRISARLSGASRETEAVRAGLQADITRAAESQARLIGSDAFGYALMTLTGELVHCNNAFARTFGYADTVDVITRSAGRPFPGLSNRPELAARLAREGRIDRVTSCVDRVDGRPIRIMESAVVITGDRRHRDGAPLVEHIVVAGPAGPTPEELQARRLQEVGALTTAMMPELESLAATVFDRSRDQSDAEDLRATSAQVAALVQQLASFSRRQVRGTESIDLGQTIRAAEPMLRRLAGDYIAFSTALGETTPIDAQPEDLDQLLTSLVTVSRDLLPAGGTMSVQVRQGETGTAETGGSGMTGPVIAVRAAGYGVRLPAALAALDLVARRCGGTLNSGGDAGRHAWIDVTFPRCGVPTRAGLSWLENGV